MGNVWTERAIELAKICPRERFEPRALTTLENALASNANLRTTANIALACSGGSDSLALLLLMCGHFPELKDRLCVLHLNHALRGSDSEGDAKFVEEVANALGADFACEKVDWGKLGALGAPVCATAGAKTPKKSVGEDFLRKLRLEFYSRAMRSKGCKILLQGHQLSDVEELLIMRLTRGAGVGGLSAPRPVSAQNDGRIFVRPLLNIPKHEIELLLKKLGIPWREDSTNAERDYFRCRVRHDVMPSISAAAPFVNIARSRMLLEETDDFLETCAEKFLQSGKKITPDIPRALLRRILIKVFAQKGAELRAKTLDALVSAIREQTPLKFTAASSARISTCPASAYIAGSSSEPEEGDRRTATVEESDCIGREGQSRPRRLRDYRANATPRHCIVKSGRPTLSVVWDGNELTVSEKSTNADNNLSDLAPNPGCGAPPHSLSLSKGGDRDVSPTSVGQKHRGEDSGLISQEVVEITPELFEKIRAGEFSPDTTAFLAGTPEISVRRWEEGDAFRPLGSPGTKTLGNLFSDKKIPKDRRHKIPVCVDAKGIAWVPGLPPAERFRVSCGMKALRLTCKRASLS